MIRALVIALCVTASASAQFAPFAFWRVTASGPAAVSSIKVWYDFSDLASITKDGSNLISAVADKSANGYSLSQSSAGARPVWMDSTRKCARFWGDDYLTVTSSTASMRWLHYDSCTALVVVRVGLSADPNTFYGIYGTNAGSSVNVGADLGYDDRSSLPRNDRLFFMLSAGGAARCISVLTDDGTFGANAYRLITLRTSPLSSVYTDRSELWIDNTSSKGNTDSNAPTTGSSTYDFQVGSLGNAIGPLVGDICEIIIYAQRLSQADIDATEAYLRAKWSTP